MPSTVGVVNSLKVIIQRLRLPVFLILSLFLMGCDSKHSSSDSYSESEASGLTGSDSLAQSGKAIYTNKCRACHDYGVAGAPRYGNSERQQTMPEHDLYTYRYLVFNAILDIGTGV